MMMSRHFDPICSPTYKTVSFHVLIDGVPCKALISRDALSDHFGAGDDPEDWVNTYISNASEIDAIVEKKIRKGGNGPVLVVSDDFQG